MPIVYTRKRHRASTQPSPTPASQHPSPAPAKRLSPPPNPPPKRRKLVQLHLDAGQLDISARKCPQCEMVYCPGLAQDEALHRRHHAKFRRQQQQPPKLPADPPRIVGSLNAGAVGVFRIVKHGDVTKHVAFAKRLDKWIARYLGEYSAGFEDEWALVFFVAGAVVRGVLVGQRVRGIVMSASNRDGGEEERRSGEFCGVTRIWVNSEWRRKGIATGMIDVLRRELVYGHIYRGEDVVFSATTQTGRQLAEGYMRRYGGRVWIYGVGTTTLLRGAWGSAPVEVDRN